MKNFEKAITDGFSCVNPRLGFDTEVLMPNLTAAEYNKMSIDESFESYKPKDLKVGYKLKLDDEDKYTDRRIISKVLKLDENNQHGSAMTKPVPTGCIKERSTPTSKEFNILLEKVPLGNKIGHLFVVNFELSKKKAIPSYLYYHEVYSPIFGKQKIIDASERSIFNFLKILKKITVNQKVTNAQKDLRYYVTE